MGDSLRVVGERAAAEEFARLVGGDHRGADETNMVPFLMACCWHPAGIIRSGLRTDGCQAGIAGGAFLSACWWGTSGDWPFRLYVPAAARNLSRELGLMLFLAGRGPLPARSSQGRSTAGRPALPCGALITALTVLVTLLLMERVYRLNLLATMGLLTGCMTNPPALNAASAQTRTDLPTVSYAASSPWRDLQDPAAPDPGRGTAATLTLPSVVNEELRCADEMTLQGAIEEVPGAA